VKSRVEYTHWHLGLSIIVLPFTNETGQTESILTNQGVIQVQFRPVSHVVNAQSLRDGLDLATLSSADIGYDPQVPQPLISLHEIALLLCP
jgi:hypothetical protein